MPVSASRRFWIGSPETGNQISLFVSKIRTPTHDIQDKNTHPPMMSQTGQLFSMFESGSFPGLVFRVEDLPNGVRLVRSQETPIRFWWIIRLGVVEVCRKLSISSLGIRNETRIGEPRNCIIHQYSSGRDPHLSLPLISRAYI